MDCNGDNNDNSSKISVEIEQEKTLGNMACNVTRTPTKLVAISKLYNETSESSNDGSHGRKAIAGGRLKRLNGNLFDTTIINSCQEQNPEIFSSNAQSFMPPTKKFYQRRSQKQGFLPHSFMDRVVDRMVKENKNVGSDSDCCVMSNFEAEGGGSFDKGMVKNLKRKFDGIDLVPEKIFCSGVDDSSRFRNSNARKMYNDRLASMQQKQRMPVVAVKLEPSESEQDALLDKKKWIEVNVDGAVPETLLNLKCKVYWPLDADWYEGIIQKFISKEKKHYIKYQDGETEELCLSEEKVKLYVSKRELQELNLKDKEEELVCKMKMADYDEMTVLAAAYDDYQGEPGHGDLVWAKVSGYPNWPAYVMDEAHASAYNNGQETRDASIPVLFFGSHDFGRVSQRNIIPFSKGFLRNFHLKCNRVKFYEGLEEVQRYLKEQKLPEEMAIAYSDVGKSKNNISKIKDTGESDADEDCLGDERDEKIKKSVNGLISCPIDLGRLCILSLGKIVRDSEHFHDRQNIWPYGYTAVRKFASIKGPNAFANYKMEVLRKSEDKNLPLFRITLEDGEQIEESNPNECWRKIYLRLDKAKQKTGNGFKNDAGNKRHHKSGSYMFGFSDRRVAQFLQALPHAKACFKFMKWIEKDSEQFTVDVMPAGYRPVNVQWKDLDRCSVCHMEEEYLNNVFLQCDKCRMMVHVNCYGVPPPSSELLWICQLCQLGTPDKWPACCLCPVTGGAMKQTTDGRWAHLTCATWIPETCLVDVKRMEPIDGVNRINRDRWKLLCSICKVHYGACIQCSDQNCRVAYHPLCARAAGLNLEVMEDAKIGKDESGDEDSEQQLRLISYCKRHGQATEEGTPDAQESLSSHNCSSYIPPVNSSGCARCEPYNFSERRGRKQPEAAARKRLFVENLPYLISGSRRNGISDGVSLNNKRVIGFSSPALTSTNQPSSKLQVDGALFSATALTSMVDKYNHMRTTIRKRLAFGKSGIHGYGIFAKEEHKAGDMIIEYTGEVVRPVIADIREHCIYNSLVGAGTYMFRIDDERVVDATRSGSIAHLINHSCEPNCYSRTINVSGDDHIIIFAKRDIQQWEELTYDYRFCSMDEQLACYCGSARCRGVVNVIDPEEQVGRISVPRNELVYCEVEDSL